MLLEQIKKDLVNHVKSGDKTKISITRLLLAALKDKEISLRNSEDFDVMIDDIIIMEIINKMIKQRNIAAKTYLDANRVDLAEKEELEVKLLSNYLPAQLSATDLNLEIDKLIKKLSANSLRDMSKVMKALKVEFSGKCDFQLASHLVKEKLSSK